MDYISNSYCFLGNEFPKKEILMDYISIFYVFFGK